MPQPLSSHSLLQVQRAIANLAATLAKRPAVTQPEPDSPRTAKRKRDEADDEDERLEDELYESELRRLQESDGTTYPAYFDDPSMAGFPVVQLHRRRMVEQAEEASRLLSAGGASVGLQPESIAQIEIVEEPVSRVASEARIVSTASRRSQRPNAGTRRPRD